MTLHDIAKALGGDVNGAWINIPGPGHRLKDRSLGVKFVSKALGNFLTHSLAGDDPAACRTHVEKLLQKIAKSEVFAVNAPPEINEAEQFKNAKALAIWNQSVSPLGTQVETYLSSRGCMYPGVFDADALRFHSECPFGLFRFPAMVALARDVITGETVGIHRTALKDDGCGKRIMPNDMNPKMMMGRAKGTALMFQPSSLHIGIAEGIETTLSAQQIFKIPTWAAMSAPGIAGFPVIQGLKHLTIFADHDRAGLDAARMCGGRYAKAGVEVQIRHPLKVSTDWNQYLLEHKDVYQNCPEK
jgi:hypothetical protein